MDPQTIKLALLTLISWGTGGFIAKLAANRIGSRSIFWDMTGYAMVAIIYSLIIFKPPNIASGDKTGIALAIMAGAIGSVGGVGFYILMSRRGASLVAPLTALYPALTAVLAFVFLRESMTFSKITGIVLATLAIYVLSL